MKRTYQYLLPLLILAALLAVGCGQEAPQAYTATIGLERVQPQEVAEVLAADGLTLTPLAVRDDALDVDGRRPSLYEMPGRNGYLLIYDFDTPALRDELARQIFISHDGIRSTIRDPAQTIVSRYGLSPEEATEAYQPENYHMANGSGYGSGICCRNLLLLYVLRTPAELSAAAVYPPSYTPPAYGQYPSRTAQVIYDSYYALARDTQTVQKDDVIFTLSQQIGGYWWGDTQKPRPYFDGWWDYQISAENRLPQMADSENCTRLHLAWGTTSHGMNVTAPDARNTVTFTFRECQNDLLPPSPGSVDATATFPDRAPVTVTFTLPADKTWPAPGELKDQIRDLVLNSQATPAPAT